MKQIKFPSQRESYTNIHWHFPTRGRLRESFIVVALLLLLSLGSCKSRQTVVRERYAVHDTVWSVRNDRTAQRDSIVYYEFTAVRPHILKLRDTTIVYTDTVVRSVTNRNAFNFVYQYRDTGRIVRDTAYIKASPVPSSGRGDKAQRTSSRSGGLGDIAVGLIIGVLLSIAWKHRKGLWKTVERLVKRTV